MDILYILGRNCSNCYDYELRYSLRSLEMYGRGVDRVYVCGYCPDWLSDDVIKVPFVQEIAKTQKEKNYIISDAIIYSSENTDIGDEFLVSMDDHFYTKATDFNSYPFYVNNSVNRGYLPTPQQGESKEYFKVLYECGELLKEFGLPTLYFTLHRNLHASKDAIKKCKHIFETSKNRGVGFELFVVLNNYRFSTGEITPTFVDDVKMHGGCDWWKVNNAECFSTYDFSKGSGLDTLISGLYPNKCKYEK